MGISFACFGVRVSVMFHLMFVYYTFSSVLVAEWPLFEKKLPTRNREADQRLCFRYIDSTIPLLSKSEISSLLPSYVAVQPGL